jgi:hypothetical protein
MRLGPENGRAALHALDAADGRLRCDYELYDRPRDSNQALHLVSFGGWGRMGSGAKS